MLSPPDGDGDLHAAFPGGAAFTEAARIGSRFDRIVVHFQPALYYRPRAPLSKIITSLRLWRLVRRCPRTELVIHEADPPIRWRPDYALLRKAFADAGRLSFHTRAEEHALESEYHVQVRGAVIPHAVASSAAGQALTRERARELLGLPDNPHRPVFVCAGFIQPSKGFDRAVEAFAAVSGDGPDGGNEWGGLYIVGSIRDHTPENDAFLRTLEARCSSVPGVTLRVEYGTDEEFDRWVTAADWVVLPYRGSWSSGVLARAHALGTPAIVSSVGGLAEQASERDMVFDDDEGLTRAMKEAGASVPSAVGARRPGSSPPDPPGRTPRRRPGPPDELADWDPEFQPPIPKKGRGMLFALILVSVLLAATAQITLKHGMTQVTHHGALPLDLKQPVATFRRIGGNIAVWGGLLIFVGSAAIWLLVLSRASLSFAYPFVSLTYVFILLFDRFVLNESVTSLRWAGVALIIGGILLISRTHQTT